MNIPCDLALQAMPGDKISYQSPDSVGSEIVVSAGWQPAPKGGKIWTYQTQSGALIPYEIVTKVEKNNVSTPQPTLSIELEHDDNYYLKRDLLSLIDRYEMSSSLKTAIFGIIEGDEKSLIVAEFLVHQRLSQLRSMNGINHPNNSDVVKQGENNGQ